MTVIVILNTVCALAICREITCTAPNASWPSTFDTFSYDALPQALNDINAGTLASKTAHKKVLRLKTGREFLLLFILIPFLSI